VARDTDLGIGCGVFVLINALNLINVKVFGEAEFWFAIIKVLAVIGMIAMGSYLLVSGNGGPQASLSNLWQHGGFFPTGWPAWPCPWRSSCCPLAGWRCSVLPPPKRKTLVA
jgi:amino acid permease